MNAAVPVTSAAVVLSSQEGELRLMSWPSEYLLDYYEPSGELASWRLGIGYACVQNPVQHQSKQPAQSRSDGIAHLPKRRVCERFD